VENWKVISTSGITAWVVLKYPVVKLFAIKTMKYTAFVVIGTIELAAEKIGLA